MCRLGPDITGLLSQSVIALSVIWVVEFHLFVNFSHGNTTVGCTK